MNFQQANSVEEGSQENPIKSNNNKLHTMQTNQTSYAQTVSIYKKLDSSRKVVGFKTVDELTDFIRNSALAHDIEAARASGKSNPELKYVSKTYDPKTKNLVETKRNLYNHVKSTQVACVSWAFHFDEYRKKDSSGTFTGYIYIDVDDFQSFAQEEGIAISECFDKIKNKIAQQPFVKWVAKSFGGKGLGALVKVEEGLTHKNYTSTWKSIEAFFSNFGITIDPATKDYTRINVLSYDPEIFVRPNSEIEAFPICEPQVVYEDTTKMKIEISDEQASGMLSEVLNPLLSKKDLFVFDEQSGSMRATHNLFFLYFMRCNQLGINPDVAFSYLYNHAPQSLRLHSRFINYNDEMHKLCYMDVYARYKDQHGQFAVKTPQGFFAVGVRVNNSKPVEWQQMYVQFCKEYYNDNPKRAVASVKYLGIDKTLCAKHFTQSIIESVYDSINHPFGVLLNKEDEQVLQSHTIAFIEKLKQHGYNTVWNTSAVYPTEEFTSLWVSESEYEKGVDSTHEYKFLIAIAKSAIKNAVPANELITHLQKIYTIDPIKIDLVINEVYAHRLIKFGVDYWKEMTTEKLAARHNIAMTLTLPSDKKLSALNLKISDKTILWADTGLGKTTWICKYMSAPRIIIVPVIASLQQIENEHKASVYFEDKKSVLEGDNLIVCTYSSFESLFFMMKNWKYNPISNYELYIDEYHNYAVSTSHSFRNKELNFVADNLHHFKKCVAMTGTLVPVMHPVFAEFQVIRVKREETPVKNYTIVHHEDWIASIERRLVKGKKNIIYLQNKKQESKFGDINFFLQQHGWSVLAINADTKKEAAYQSIIKNNMIPDGYDVILCTSVAVEAISIYNTDVETLHFATFEHPVGMEQMVNRFRVQLPSNIFVYIKKQKKSVHRINDVDTMELQKELITRYSEYLKLICNESYNGSSSKRMIQKMVNNFLAENRFLRFTENGISLDYLAIANKCFIEEKSFSQKNPKYMDKFLKEYNWVLNKQVDDTTIRSQEDKELMKTNKEAVKEEKKNLIEQAIENIENGGENTLGRYDGVSPSSLDTLGQIEAELCYHTAKMCRHMDFTDAITIIKRWLDGSATLGDQKIARIHRQLNLLVAKKLNAFDRFNVAIDEFSQAILTYVQGVKQREAKNKNKPQDVGIGKIVNRFCAYKHLSETYSKVSNDDPNISTIALNAFKQLVGVEEVLIGTELRYIFTGVKLSHEVAAHSKELIEFFDKKHQEYKNKEGDTYMFTTIELAEIMNQMRSKYLFLSKVKVNSRTASMIANDFVTIAQNKNIWVNGKRINRFVVSEPTPDMFDGIEIKPFRNIPLPLKHIDDMTESEKHDMGYYIGYNGELQDTMQFYANA